MLISISLMYTCQLYPTPTHRHDTLALPSTERVAWRRAKTHSTAPPQKEGSSALVRPSSLIAWRRKGGNELGPSTPLAHCEWGKGTRDSSTIGLLWASWLYLQIGVAKVVYRAVVVLEGIRWGTRGTEATNEGCLWWGENKKVKETDI
jgi:hypothetical protein